MLRPELWQTLQVLDAVLDWWDSAENSDEKSLESYEEIPGKWADHGVDHG